MTYDLEKHLNKREKVLGVKNRGISFAALAAIVSLILILGLGVVVIPKSITYLSSRNLDDAVYKLQDAETWSHIIISDIKNLKGVKKVSGDSNGTRIVVTFDRTHTDIKSITAYLTQKELKPVLLNRVSHSQRLKTLKKEAKFGG
ncbi:MAG: hypothetical protein JSV73_03975 [Flavobacteriaceae bacterium]|nr:MAG: hypothetical protein JSV73_03975 [Flavobacteriaceae bacterium]